MIVTSNESGLSAEEGYLKQRYHPSPYIVCTRIGDETVIVHLKTDRMYALNLTASRIWELLCAGLVQKEIEQTLLEEFETSATQLANEVKSLLISLCNEQFIVPTEIHRKIDCR
jgi:hypothetical protein